MTMSIEPDQVHAAGRGAIPADAFGNRLMLARAHAGHISIREAADLCGIGRGAWTNWEKGARPVDIIEVTAVIADKLGIDREWLLFGGQLADAEPRSLRRFRPTGGRPVIGEYLPLADRTIPQAVSRPPGPFGSTRPGGGLRTALLPRRVRPSAG